MWVLRVQWSQWKRRVSPPMKDSSFCDTADDWQVIEPANEAVAKLDADDWQKIAKDSPKLVDEIGSPCGWLSKEDASVFTRTELDKELGLFSELSRSFEPQLSQYTDFVWLPVKTFIVTILCGLWLRHWLQGFCVWSGHFHMYTGFLWFVAERQKDLIYLEKDLFLVFGFV